jgi:hypothetical protein
MDDCVVGPVISVGIAQAIVRPSISRAACPGIDRCCIGCLGTAVVGTCGGQDKAHDYRKGFHDHSFFYSRILHLVLQWRRVQAPVGIRHVNLSLILHRRTIGGLAGVVCRIVTRHCKDGCGQDEPIVFILLVFKMMVQ